MQKLRDQEIERIGHELGQLRLQRAEVEQLSATIHQQTLDALSQPAENHLPFTAQFVSEAARLQKSLVQEVVRLEAEEAGQENDLVDAFVEAKSIEMVLEATLTAVAEEIERKDVEELSERAAFAYFKRVQNTPLE